MVTTRTSMHGATESLGMKPRCVWPAHRMTSVVPWQTGLSMAPLMGFILRHFPYVCVRICLQEAGISSLPPESQAMPGAAHRGPVLLRSASMEVYTYT